MRGQLRRRPHTLVSKGFDPSVVGVSVIVFDVRVRGATGARFVSEMLVAQLRVVRFDSEREREPSQMLWNTTDGLMMTGVNRHTDLWALRGKMLRNSIRDSVWGGKYIC